MYFNQNEIPFERMLPNTRLLYTGILRGKKEIVGLDTETLYGYAKLVTDSAGRYKWLDTIQDSLEFLTMKPYRDTINFFYNLKFDAQSLLKKLPEKEMRELYDTTETVFEEWHVKYIPGKLLKISHKKHSYIYFDIAQFYLSSLANAAEKYLGEKKNEEGVDAPRLNKDPLYWNERKDDILKYCIHDSWLTFKLGELLQETMTEALGYAPQGYISLANVIKQYAVRKCDMPDLRKVNREYVKYAFQCYHGGRFELLKKGYFKWISSLDIVSAYPWHMSNLVQVSDGEWRKVKEVDYDALHGFYLCVVHVPEYILPPFIVNAPKKVKMFPKGTFATYLTLNEIDHYGEYCDIKVKVGYEFKGKVRKKPLEKILVDMYKLKEGVQKEDFRYKVYKTLMNALYGTFYEKLDNGGNVQEAKSFNAFWASEITANTRIQVYEEAIKHGNRVIGFATDAVIVEGKVEYPETGPLGGFTKDTEGEAVMLQTGMNEIGGKTKTRGMAKGENIKRGGIEYESIFDLIRARPLEQVYDYTKREMISTGRAMTQTKKWKVGDINVMYDMPTSLDINKDMKRRWEGTFANGGELMERHIESGAVDADRLEGTMARMQRGP